MRRIGNVVMLVALAMVLSPMASWAQVTPYSQDFEGLVQADPAALENDGWWVYGNVFDPAGGYLYGYGPFPAPNGGPAFSAIATGQGGGDQGQQQLVVYSDYNNADHANGFLIEANVFQEQTITAADIGITVDFTFDAKMGDLGTPPPPPATEGDVQPPPPTALAFIKTINPDPPYNTVDFVTLDMTSIPDTWGTYQIQLLLAPGLEGYKLQFGFQNTSTLYWGTGIFYDNINQPVPVELMSFSVE